MKVQTAGFALVTWCQYRDWDQYVATAQRRQPAGLISARALAHQPMRAARREFEYTGRAGYAPEVEKSELRLRSPDGCTS